MTAEPRNAALVVALRAAAVEALWTCPQSLRPLFGMAAKALEEADARYATVERRLGELGVTIGAIDLGCEGVHVEELLRLIMAKARADREKLGG